MPIYMCNNIRKYNVLRIHMKKLSVPLPATWRGDTQGGIFFSCTFSEYKKYGPSSITVFCYVLDFFLKQTPYNKQLSKTPLDIWLIVFFVFLNGKFSFFIPINPNCRYVSTPILLYVFAPKVFFHLGIALTRKILLSVATKSTRKHIVKFRFVTSNSVCTVCTVQ